MYHPLETLTKKQTAAALNVTVRNVDYLLAAGRLQTATPRNGRAQVAILAGSVLAILNAAMLDRINGTRRRGWTAGRSRKPAVA